jgi:hypothetical protein
MNDQDEYPFARPRELEWLARRGLCYPQTAASTSGASCFRGKSLPRPRQEYQPATVNYAPDRDPDHLGKFTACRPDAPSIVRLLRG